jgi:phosphate:Na+ symporter
LTFSEISTIIIAVIGGLGLFLLGMKNMSEGMQAIAGDKIRKLINTVTDNRFVACGVGSTVTALIQSSSVTTVMVVGMVNAGIMTLKQSIGVIMGAGIGTTITAWLIALKISDYGLPILGISSIFYLFAKFDRVRYTAMMFVGLGMVFFGLEIMKEGLLPLRDNEQILELMSQFVPTDYFGLIKCIGVGALVTAMIQSSSATVAITITLAKTGIIGYDTAVALVLGENIGTTITAYLASLGASTNAKRSAFIHISINVFGVLMLFPIFYYYLSFLNSIFDDNIGISSRIAFAHSGFNILTVSILIWLIEPLKRFVTFLVPGKDHEEQSHLTYLDVRMIETPLIAIQQSYDEIMRMAKSVQKMFDWLRTALSKPKKKESIENQIFHREQVLDITQKEVVEFISKLMKGTAPQNIADEARKQLRLADEYESLSDYVVNVIKILNRMKKYKVSLSEHERNELISLHDLLTGYLDFIYNAVQNQNNDILSKAMTENSVIRRKIKNFRSSHLNRLAAEQTSPILSLAYMDLLNSYRRMLDHAFNIAEVLSGGK